MRSRLFTWIFASWIALSAVSAAAASKTFDGVILRAGKATITLHAKDGALLTFRVDPAATILMDGKKASLSDLRMGDAISITTEKRAGVEVCIAINARTKQ